MAKNSLNGPGRALQIGANVGTVFASRSAKAALSSLPGMIDFIIREKGITLGNLFDFLPSKWNKV